MATIQTDSLGVSAFTADNHLVMNNDSPCVEWSFRIKSLEDWLTTLEEIMLHESMFSHRRSIEGLYFSLKAAHTKHKQQHEEVVTEAPTADDLMEYLKAYAGAMCHMTEKAS